MSIIHVQNLNKSFGKTEALKGISLEVNEGEIYGLIGPDGAGKTTLFRILTTLLKPDEGQVSVLGLDVVRDYKSIRPRLGYMPGRFALYHNLSVRENLEFFASVFGTTIDANYELIKPVYQQLEPFRGRLAGALSGGMKQKLALCCALIHRPEILLLDEPTTGVDAVSRKEFWDMLYGLKKQNITIVASTPYMDEALRCDRIALIQDGSILSVDTPSAVVNKFDRQLLAIKAPDRYRLILKLRDYEFAASVHPFGEFVHYTDTRDAFSQQDIRRYLEENGFGHIVIQEITPQIEDTFMQLMEPVAPHE